MLWTALDTSVYDSERFPAVSLVNSEPLILLCSCSLPMAVLELHLTCEQEVYAAKRAARLPYLFSPLFRGYQSWQKILCWSPSQVPGISASFALFCVRGTSIYSLLFSFHNSHSKSRKDRHIRPGLIAVSFSSMGLVMLQF